MKTTMKKYEVLRKPLIITLYDYKTFFDSESCIDVLQEAYKAGIRGKIYRLFYKLNWEKSAFMVIGSRKQREDILSDMEKSPLMLCNKQMKHADEYLYLGAVISESGLGDSAALSVKRKAAKVKHLSYQIRAVLEDTRNNTPGSLCTALQIWELAVVPYLYFGAECWIDLKENTLKILTNLELSFYRIVLRTPKSCPTAGIFWSVGACTPENRILKAKLLFYYHLSHLDRESLASRIFREERKSGIGGFISECEEEMSKLGISEDEVGYLNKGQFKRRTNSLIEE